MRKSLALFGLSLAVLMIGCSGGEEQPAPSGGTKPGGNMNGMKADDPTKGTIPGSGDAAGFTAVKASLENFCYPCHTSANKKDDVDIESLKTSEELKKVAGLLAEEVEKKKMPPANAPKQPTDEERAALVTALKGM